MAKYLDEIGLRTLWGKIKDRDTNVKNEVTGKIDTINSQLQGLQGSKVDKVELDNYYVKTEVDTKLGTKLDTSKVGANGGIASLGSDGKVPSSQLPSYVDDVLEFDTKTAFPKTGEGGKIYISKNDNKTYRWSGTAYVEISASLALGETVGTAYAGDKGKKNADNITSLTERVAKTERDIQNVFNTNFINSNDNYVKVVANGRNFSVAINSDKIIKSNEYPEYDELVTVGEQTEKLEAKLDKKAVFEGGNYKVNIGGPAGNGVTTLVEFTGASAGKSSILSLRDTVTYMGVKSH